MPFPLLGAFLAVSVGALVKRALVALGLGIVTYNGLDVVFNAVKMHVIANYSAMAGASLNLADLAGVGQVIGIILGALAGRIGILVLSSIGRVL